MGGVLWPLSTSVEMSLHLVVNLFSPVDTTGMHFWPWRGGVYIKLTCQELLEQSV